MSKQRGPRDFDLTNKHLNGERNYVPPKARDETEIERRRSLPRGTLITEFQQRGLQIAHAVLAQVHQPEDLRFASRFLAASSINAAWYTFAEEAPVMRRRLKLPVLTAEIPEERPSSYMIHLNALDVLARATEQARGVIANVGLDHDQAEYRRRQFGRTVGHGALTIASISLGDTFAYDRIDTKDADVQLAVRDAGLRTLQDARFLQADIGTAPSLAQLADPDSDLSVFWRRNAPNGALEAYHAAIETT